VIDSILVPLDGSPLATRALLLVRRIVEHRAAFHEPAPRIHLVRAAGPEELAAAREELDVVAAQIGASAEAHVLEGDAAAGILAVVSETKPALVIMASHGRGGLDRWLRGSVAERVLRACPAPLLVANPWALERSAARGEHPFEKILVPLDGSARAKSVLGPVAALARELDATLVLLHVLAAGQDADEARDWLDACRSELGGLRVETRVERGLAAPGIIEALRAGRGDLVAVATHGKTGPESWFFGSVAERILHESAAPIFVVRTGGFFEGRRQDREKSREPAQARP